MRMLQPIRDPVRQQRHRLCCTASSADSALSEATPSLEDRLGKLATSAANLFPLWLALGGDGCGRASAQPLVVQEGVHHARAGTDDDGHGHDSHCGGELPPPIWAFCLHPLCRP